MNDVRVKEATCRSREEEVMRYPDGTSIWGGQWGYEVRYPNGNKTFGFKTLWSAMLAAVNHL